MAKRSIRRQQTAGRSQLTVQPRAPVQPILPMHRPVHRGLQMLERLDALAFGHTVRGLSIRLTGAAAGSELSGAADPATLRAARRVAAQLWRLYPPPTESRPRPPSRIRAAEEAPK
jgi:hypothetical protein